MLSGRVIALEGARIEQKSWFKGQIWIKGPGVVTEDILMRHYDLKSMSTTENVKGQNCGPLMMKVKPAAVIPIE